jgi:hypothetical protein
MYNNCNNIHYYVIFDNHCLEVVLHFVHIDVIVDNQPLNSDGQQLHQYQQNVVLPLNSDGQQFYQDQQNVILPLNSDCQQLHQYYIL